MNIKREWARFRAWFVSVYLPGLIMAWGKITPFKRMLRDKRAESKVGEWIGLVITLIIGVILVPIIVDQVQNTNTTGWTFTGHSGASTLFLLLPFVFIIGMIVYFIARLLGKI